MSSTSAHSGLGVLAALLLFPLCADAQQSSVEVRSPSAKISEATPGKIITASFVVENRDDRADDFVELLVLPRGWRKVSPPDTPFPEEARSQTVRIIALLVPANAPAGNFQIDYAVRSRRDPLSSGNAGFIVHVARVEKLDLALLDHPELVIAGDRYDLRLVVTNNGNEQLPLHLAAQSSANGSVTLQPENIKLAPGESREVSVRVQTKNDVRAKLNDAITVTATAEGTTASLSASQTALADVIPLETGDADPYHRLPTRLRQTFISENGHDAQLQLEFRGEGTLDEAGRQHVDFLLRGPDLQGSALFGERDEYGATYSDDNWRLDLGDRIYSLSPLTELRALGRGAGAAWHDNGTAVGAFYMMTRYRANNSDEIGAFVSQEVGLGMTLQGNFLRKTDTEPAERDVFPQDIFSLEARYHPSKALDLRLEGGISESDSGLADRAYRAEAHGEIGKTQYAVEYAFAGPDFHGYYNDTETINGAITFPIVSKFTGHLEIRRYAGNLDLNPEKSSVVTRENSYSGGINYAWDKQTDLLLELQHIGREDILLPAEFDFTERSVRAGGSHNFGQLQLRSFVDVGTIENELVRKTYDFTRENLFVTWQPTANQTYSLFAAYGPSSFTGSADREIAVGVSGQLKINQHFDVTANYARNEFDGLTGREFNQVFGVLRYTLQDKSELALTARATRSSVGWRNESAVMLSYSIPLGLPVSRKQSIGMVQGRVLDVEKNIGVGRAIVTDGTAYAVTNSDGQFKFPALKPGDHELRVQRDSLGDGRIAEDPAPVEVKVLPAGSTSVKLPVVRAGSASVKLVLCKSKGNSWQESGGLEAGLVELTNGVETLRQETDRLGAAVFENLRPGKWTLRVYNNGLSAFYYVEKSKTTIEVKAAEVAQATIRVIEKVRAVQMIDVGSLH